MSKNKNDPFTQNVLLRTKLAETNRMLLIDNQSLLDKIKNMDKSIKPVIYGVPYINLSKDNEVDNNPYF